MNSDTHQDPLERAVASAESDFWTMRPPADVRRLVVRAIREDGRDKGFWVFDCLRAGLAKYARKKDQGPVKVKASK